ncbi:ABC transporter permease [Carboxylicivirga sp. M1479]|uniref:ABC transporter permease n=1 Tax=Carboxylicivirga sp. M1479 TaxID=2594476 RepID=UPI00117787BD|nr:ABC transporter permease [Carboxylicivirga sp. M1479]TRX72664.1 FtsX-like permease family protein [Carboxylicivirga sp. M1479]
MKLKFIIRGILAYRYNAARSLLGLTIGLSCFTIILVWAYAHWSFDRFHEGAENIYLIQNTDTVYYETDMVMPFPLAQELRDHIPEMANTATLTMWPDQDKLSADGSTLFVPITSVEPQVFDILDFDIIASNGKPLMQPDAMALSKSLAIKLFGSSDCIGENLLVKDSILAHVGTVYKDFPENSTFKPVALCSYALNEAAFVHCSGWDSNCYVTLCKVPAKADVKKIGQLITQLLHQEHDKHDLYALSPLTSYHFQPIGEKSIVSHLLMIFFSGLLVLLVSTINYVNLQTAINNKRNKQQAIKRMLGASAFDRVKEALVEIVIYLGLAFLSSIVLSYAILPFIGSVTGLKVLQIVDESTLLLIHLCSAIVIFIVVATYMVLSNAKDVVNGNSLMEQSKKNKLSRGSKVFVVAQFTLAIFIGIAALVMHKQLVFAIESDKGYDSSDLMVVETWDYPFDRHKAAITEYLSSNPNVASFSVCERGFNKLGSRTTGFKRDDWSPEENNFYNVMYRSDEHLLDVVNIPLLAGRFFEPLHFNESKKLVVNETYAIKLGGVNEVINTSLTHAGEDYKIIGVCKDFIFENYYQEIEPLVMLYRTQWICGLMIKSKPGKYAQIAAGLNDLMRSKSDAPFEIDSMEALLSNMYNEEDTQQKLLLLFSILIIVISSLGLVGLTTFIIENSTKEIGIRKVNGATVPEVLLMINVDFIKWVGLAFVLAASLAFVSLNQWLNNFAFRIHLSWWFFIVVGGFALFIALTMVSWQTWRAARRNPVEALRYE